MLRLALRAWREVRDGVQAGTARWEARWERDDAEGALARRVMFGPRDKEGTVQVTQEAFYGEEAWQLRTLLAYMRLVRAGHVGAARRRSPTWQRVQHERRLRDLQISWEHAMPGERCQKYSWREEEAVSDERGVTSGAAAVHVRRAQQQQSERQQQQQQQHMLENELGPQRRMPNTPRPSAQLPAVSQPSQCGECDERNEPTMETIDSGHSTAMPAAGAETDQPAHLRSRWTDTLLSLTPHAHTIMCRHLGIVNAAQPPDARLRDARRPRGDG